MQISQPRFFKNKKTGFWDIKYRVYYDDGTVKDRFLGGSKRGWSTKKKALSDFNEFFVNKPKNVNKITLKEVSDHYLKIYKINNKYTSYSKAKNSIDHIINVFGNFTVEKIRPKNLLDYFASIHDKYSNSEISKRYVYAKALFAHAQKYFDVQNDPFKHLKRPKKIEMIQEKSIWKLEDFEAVISVIDHAINERKKMPKDSDFYWRIKEALLHKAIIYTLFWTGLRKSELLALECQDIKNFDGTFFIDINKGLSRTENGLKKLSTKTTRSKRQIPIHDKLASIILELIDIHKKTPDFRKSYDLFSMTGKAISYNTLARLLKKYAELAQVPIITPHNLRHSHGSLLINKGVDITIVSDRLGHTSVETTLKRYFQLYEQRKKEAVLRIEQLDT